MKYLLLALLLLFLGSSCENTAQQENTDPTPTETPEGAKDQSTEERVDPAPKPAPYLITEEGFYGIRPGAAIADLPIKVEKGTIQDGEGEFDAYYVIDELDGERLGYFYPDVDDPTAVGDLIVTSAKGKTADGLGAGSTYEALQQALGTDYEVHGSEIESRVHVQQGKVAFRMDFLSMDYDLAQDAVPATSEVLYVQIRR